MTSPSPSTQPPSSSSASFASPPSAVIPDDLPTLLIQMQETISQIHTTIITLQPPFSSPDHGAGGGDPYPIASPEERLKITDLVTRRESAIRSLLNAFTAETQFLSQKRRVEREEMLERRRAEDAELQRRRKEEDEQWEEKLRLEDEERERTLEKERGEVEKETEELMGEIEKGWERRWEEEMGRLRGLEGRRKELNRLIDEKLQMHTETSLPLNSRAAIREARKASALQMLEPEQSSPASEQEEEEAETPVIERGFLPAAAFENAPPDFDREYKLPESESEQEEEEEEEEEEEQEPLTRDVPVGETGSALSHLRENMASMSMDDLLNRPDELSVAAPVPIPVAAASRPTSPVARTLSAAVDMEEEDIADTVSVGDLAAVEESSNEPFPKNEPSESIQERKLEIKTQTTDTNRDTSSIKTSLVDVEFRGLPICERLMDRNLRWGEFAEVEEEEEEEEENGEEKDDGGRHCGLPVGHHHVGSTDTAPVIVEQTATEARFRGRHDSLGIIHPPASPRGAGEETEKAAVPRPASTSPESETSDYTPYAQGPPALSITSADRGTDTHANPPDTVAATDHHVDLNPPDTGLPPSTHPINPPDTAPANADSKTDDIETNPPSVPNPNPEETSQASLLPDPSPNDIDTLRTVPSHLDADVDADSSISTASERGSYTDINEPTSPLSPTAAKAMEEDDDADFVPEQWQGGDEVQMQMQIEGMEREGEALEGQGQGQKEEEVLIDDIEDVLEEELRREYTAQESVERAQGCITLAVAEIESEWERDHQQEHDLGANVEAVEKKVLEKEVLQGLVDEPVGPAHDGRFELQEEATRARGVLEPYASKVDLGQGDEAHNHEQAQRYEEAERPTMGVEGVAEPCVTREELLSSGHGPEHEAESEPRPVPVEELVREQEEMGLGRPEPHDPAECEGNEGHTPPVQMLDMDHHPLDHSHISHVVGVALTHSEPVHMRHTPNEEGDHEPAHYFVNQHRVPHSTDDFYTPVESPLYRYDHHQEHLDNSYAPGDHAEEQEADEEAYREREIPDVSEEAEEDVQPRYQLYERPYTPSDLAPTPGLEASFHSVDHAVGTDGQPEVVITSQDYSQKTTAGDHREDTSRLGDEQDTKDDDDDDEIGYQLERVPSRQDVTEEQESPGPCVDEFPAVSGEADATAEHQHAVPSGDVHHRVMEPGQEDDIEDAHAQEALSSESESEDFEGRDDIVLHHLDAIAEEECDEVEAELGNGVERRDMAAEAEKQAEGHAHVDDEVEAAALSDEHDIVRNNPVDVDESTVILTSDSLTKPSELERIHEEGPDTRLSEVQPAIHEAPDIDLEAAHPVTEQEHVAQEHQADEAQQPYANPDDDEYDPFRYSFPKKISKGQVTPAEQPNVERSPDKVLGVEEATSVLSHEMAARTERSWAEELEDVGEEEEAQESDYEGDRHDHHLEEEDVQKQGHHHEQPPVEPVAVEDQVGHGYRSSDQEKETVADDGHSPDHDEGEAQPSQPCEPPVLQLTEPSDTENGEFHSETSSISCHPHAVTRGEDMGRDWSEVDQFLSESDYEDEVKESEHVEETDAGADAVAHAHPSVDVDIDTEVEAALETPTPEAKPADDTAELHEGHHDNHVGMHHSPEPAPQSQETNPDSATYDDMDSHDHDNRPSTPLDQLSQSDKPGDDHHTETVTPAHPHDLPSLTIPTTPPGPAKDVSHEIQQQPKEEEQESVPRDVTNRSWRSDTVNTVATFATADTSGTVLTASSPQSARSGTTLSSGPSSPVVEESASSQDPRIRDTDSIGANLGRPRGSSSVTDAGTDYSGGGYGDSLEHHDKGGQGIKDRASTPKITELWHQREASISRNEEVRLSGESGRSSSHNRVASGSGSGSTGGGGGGSSLFQRMRSVFEQSSSSNASASAPAASTSNNRVSMPSFFTKSHTSSPSQSVSVFESTVAKQRPMSTSPYPAYSSSHHRSQNGYTPPATTRQAEAEVAEQAGEDSALLHRDAADDTSSDGYGEAYEGEKERRKEWREGQGMVHAYGEESGSVSTSRYDYGEYRPE